MNSNIDNVAAALIPDVHDEAAVITRARDGFDLAMAETDRAQGVFLAAIERMDELPDTQVLAEYIVATRDYGQALQHLADAETALHLATLDPDLAAKLRAHIEAAETFAP